MLLLSMAAGCAPEATDPQAPRPGETVSQTWHRLLEIDPPRQRTAALARFLTTLGPGDVDAIRAILFDFHRRQRAVDDLLLVNALAELSPVKAAQEAIALKLPYGEPSHADVVLEWAKADPIAATAALALEEPSVERALVRGWYESGEPGLEEYVLEQGPTRTGQRLISTYVAEIAAVEGPEALVGWIDDVRARGGLPMAVIVQAHRKGMSALAVVDAERAMAYCDEHCDQPYADTARLRITDRLALLGQPERAVRWLSRSEGANEQERGAAGRIAFRAWMRRETQEALDWAAAERAAEGDSPWMLPLQRLVLSYYTRRDPEQALTWISVLPTEQEREDALVRIGRRWLELDREAGEAWIDSSPLDEAARVRARTPAKRRKTVPPPSPPE